MVKDINILFHSCTPLMKTIKNSILIALNKYPGLPDYAKEILDTMLNNDEVVTLLLKLRDHDEYTFKHSINVAVLSFLLGFNLGLNKEELIELTIGALLHDIGKSQVPLNVLNKPGRLTKEEFDVIRNHSVDGYNLAKDTNLPKESKDIILYHHVRLDGSGYPAVENIDSISERVQIVSLCDVFDALTGDRVYKPGMTKAAAYRIIHSEMTNQLNMKYLDALLDCFAIFDVGDITTTSEGDKCKIIALNTENLNRPIIEIIEGPDTGKIIDLNLAINLNLRYT